MASLPLLRLSVRPLSSPSTSRYRSNINNNNNNAAVVGHLHSLKVTSSYRSNNNKNIGTLGHHSLTVKVANPRPLPPSSFSTLSDHPKLRIIRNSYKETTSVTDRLISVVGFCVPFFNGLQFGRFLLSLYPPISVVFQPIFPLVSLYHSIPFGSIVAFFALFIFVARNIFLSRYVRLNALQAIVLDVLLALPVLVQRIVDPGPSGIGFLLMGAFNTAVFLLIVVSFVYSVVTCVRGKTPNLPIVADVAQRQLDTMA